MADYNEIEDKAEEAVKALLVSAAPSALSGLTIHLGQGALALGSSRVEVAATEAEEHDETGNWVVTLVVRTVTNSGDAASPEADIRTKHKKRSAAVADLCLRDTFVADLNTAYATEPFTAMAWTEFTKSRMVEGKELISEFQGKLLCCGSNP